MSFHCNPAHTRCGYYSFITDFLQPAQLSFKPNHKWFRCQWYYTSQPVVLRLLALHQQDQFTHHKSQDCAGQICRKQKWKTLACPLWHMRGCDSHQGTHVCTFMCKILLYLHHSAPVLLLPIWSTSPSSWTIAARKNGYPVDFQG